MTPAPDDPNAAETALFENLRLELRRGGLVLAVLGQLRAEHYGYTLRKALAERGLPVDEGTLYPLLRRLESQGLLTSEWREEDKREKRFYRLSPAGRARRAPAGRRMARAERLHRPHPRGRVT